MKKPVKTPRGLERKFKNYYKDRGKKLDPIAILVLFGCNVNLTGEIHDRDLEITLAQLDEYYKPK